MAEVEVPGYQAADPSGSDDIMGLACRAYVELTRAGSDVQARVNEDLVAVGLTIGAALLLTMDRALPHSHAPDGSRTGTAVWLFVFAIAVHNIPEGLALGISFIAQPHLGLLLAIAIALHNIPEGLAVAAPFRACGMPPRQYIAWALVSGLSEPVAALVGALFATFFAGLMPFSLAFAGGAMLYVVSDELIPESHSHGFEHEATLGFLCGFVLLLVLMQIV